MAAFGSTHPTIVVCDADGESLEHVVFESQMTDREFANYAGRVWLEAWIANGETNKDFPWGMWLYREKSRYIDHLWEWWQEEGRYVVAMHMETTNMHLYTKEQLTKHQLMHLHTEIDRSGVYIAPVTTHSVG